MTSVLDRGGQPLSAAMPAKRHAIAFVIVRSDLKGVAVLVRAQMHREVLSLQRVASTLNLCDALDAAQFARLYLYGEPTCREAAVAIEAFIATFGAATEAWLSPDLPNKAPLIDLLHSRLAALHRLGIFVHCATVQRTVTVDDGSRVTLPVAILAFGETPAPTRTAVLPAELRACGEETD
jgi:hypothetical protein